MKVFKQEISNVPIIVGTIVILFVIGVLLWHYTSRQNQPSNVKPTAGTMQKQKPADQIPASVKPTGPSAAQIVLATVRKGEGIEHALIRQLVDDPMNYGFTGDQNDSAAVKKWAGHQAHVLAIKAGYYDWKFGAEVRVKAPNTTAYVLQEDADGNLQIGEYAATTPQGPPTTASGGTFSPATTHGVAPTIASSQFFGASQTTGKIFLVPAYQYVYAP
jgi:hypothetical protein